MLQHTNCYWNLKSYNALGTYSVHLNVAIMEASDLMAVSLAQATVLTVSVLLVKTYFYVVVTK